MKIGKSCNLIGWEYFGQYIKIKNFPKDTCGGFAIRKYKLREFSFKIMFNKFKWQSFSKILKGSVFNIFWNRYWLWVLWISSHMQKVRRIYKYIRWSYSQPDDQGERWLGRQKTGISTLRYRPPYFTELSHHITLQTM